MSLVACAKCAKQFSKNAGQCPHCGFIVNARHRKYIAEILTEKPCRICGFLLIPAQHRWEKTTSSAKLINGTSYKFSGTNLQHKACPQCGEPRPLLQPSDKYINQLLFAMLLILHGVIANYLFDHTGREYGLIFTIAGWGVWFWYGTYHRPSLLRWFRNFV